MRKIAVIGGGASGMMAAISAARSGAETVIYERNDRVGKKILATGNGKCNFSNTNLSEQNYFSDTPDRILPVLKQFGVKETSAFFEELGICIRNKNGYLYPLPEQASAVLDVLRMELNRLRIAIHTEVLINRIEKKNSGGFMIYRNGGTDRADRVILACGGAAAPKTGSDGTGYGIAASFGHSIISPLPALVQLRCEGSYWKSVSGIRMDAAVTLVVDGKKEDSDRGELQLTDYGISGIPVFQISRNAARAVAAGRRTEVCLDLIPCLNPLELPGFVKLRFARSKEKTAEEFFCGMYPKKITGFLLKQCGIPAERPVDQIGLERLLDLAEQSKGFLVTVSAPNSLEQAQTTSGGIVLTELTDRLESVLQEGLYFAGEIVDVDGKCGGYNLQWAWSSGYLAGKSAANQ